MGFKDDLPWQRIVSDVFKTPTYTAAELKRIQSEKDKYHLIYLGRKPVTESALLQLATLPKEKGQLGRSAIFFLGGCWSECNPKQQFDFYLSVKDGGDNTLLVDRLVAAKVCPSVPPPEKK